MAKPRKKGMRRAYLKTFSQASINSGPSAIGMDALEYNNRARTLKALGITSYRVPPDTPERVRKALAEIERQERADAVQHVFGTALGKRVFRGVEQKEVESQIKKLQTVDYSIMLKTFPHWNVYSGLRYRVDLFFSGNQYFFMKCVHATKIKSVSVVYPTKEYALAKWLVGENVRNGISWIPAPPD